MVPAGDEGRPTCASKSATNTRPRGCVHVQRVAARADARLGRRRHIGRAHAQESGLRRGRAVELRWAPGCTDLKLITPSQLRCKTPPGAAGPRDVSRSGRRTPRSRAASPRTHSNTRPDRQRPRADSAAGRSRARSTLRSSTPSRARGPRRLRIGRRRSRGPYQGDDRRARSRSRSPPKTSRADDGARRAQVHGASVDRRLRRAEHDPARDAAARSRCAMPGTARAVAAGAAGSLISGELIFPGGDEFAINAWNVIPGHGPTRCGWPTCSRRRVQSTSPTRASGIGGTMARVTEGLAPRRERLPVTHLRAARRAGGVRDLRARAPRYRRVHAVRDGRGARRLTAPGDRD